MSDIFHGFAPAQLAPLTAHLRHHLVAGLRADLAHAEAARATLPRHRRHRSEAQGLRFWHLTDRIERARAELREMEAE